MPNTATRLVTLIMLLQRQSNQKAADLARELGVSVRTLHRYFTMLDEMGIPVYSERGPYGGFSLVRGYKMPPLVFTPEEAVTVYLGTSLVEQMWGHLYKDAARGALAKLENVLPDEQRHEVAWARRSLVATGMHRADFAALAPTLEKLRRAAREHRQTRMLYRGRGQLEPSEREFHPYAMVHRWGWWYVIGYCQLRQAVRTFRVDRILELALLEENFEAPADFDIHTYLANEPQMQTQVTVRMRFTAGMVSLALDDQTHWESMEEQADGSIIVTYAAPSLEWAASTALVYGPGVAVLEPEEVRGMVSEWARAIAAQYQPAG